MSITIDIPGDPVAKGRGRIGKDAIGNARIFTPKKTANYEQLIRLAAGRQMEGRDLIAGPVEVFVTAYIAPPKLTRAKQELLDSGRLRPCTRPDLDNYVKSALDGLNGIVFVDDNQVVSIYAHKMYDPKASLRITVRECWAQREAGELI